MKKLVAKTTTPVLLFFLCLTNFAFGAEPGWRVLPGHVPAAVLALTPKSRVPATNMLSLAIGLPLRNEAELEELLHQLYDPGSTNYHRFLQPAEFTARFGPTALAYAAVRNFAETNGLLIVGTHPNRVVLDVQATATNVERAFHVALHTYRHPTEARDFFAPDTAPSVPTNLPVADMWGLSDYAPPRPLALKMDASKLTPLNYNGSGPGGAYQGGDFRNAYAPSSSLTGMGQTVAVAEFDGYYSNDITNYEAQCGYTNVPLQTILLDGVSGTPGYSGEANAVAEVSLDIELAIAMAPGLAKVAVFEGNSPYDVFNAIANTNMAKQISCSWAWNDGPASTWTYHRNSTLDSILKQMVSQGQAFFQAAGDSDAYTGSQALSSSSGPIPVDSIYVTSVGGTTLNMNGTGASWASESVWNWGNNTGTGGGVSSNYAIPSWQTNVSMAANSGSTLYRNIPDVAMTADAVHVVFSNGIAGTFGGTSCAAPLWAGFCAQANQLSAATNGTTLGFLNPALYKLGASGAYLNCFHDVTTGDNIGNNTAGLFNAVAGYDLCTGLGTPNGTNLINALVWPLPSFTSQPAGKTVTNGASVTLNATASSTTTLSYAWLCNGTNLANGGNFSGTASNVLSITAVTTNNSGSYQLVAANSTGSITSSVALLNVGFAPVVITPPVSQTNYSGSNAVFTATVTGTAPLVYQWRKNGTNLAGATGSVLTLTAVTTNSSGNYSLFSTNIFGVVTSSVASLTVVVPPAIASVSLTNRTLECGKNTNTFAITVAGTVPLNIQWSTNGVPVLGATNSSFSLTNVHLPSQTVAVTVTNLYGSATNSCALTITDSLAPVITLNGASRLTNELGAAFTDPGATAYDLCAGTVPVTTNGAVNIAVVGTNTLTYIATDGSGNTNTATRTVVVRDTMPPTILWSFTNLILAADTNCSAVMPDVTGTNFILATDLSGALTIAQSPTNTAILQLGTNVVVITVKDASGNAAYSTNQIIVQDQTPPVITLNGANPFHVEFGGAFSDPGATADDNCAGLVPVTVSGWVNTNAVGTNLLTYTATDGSGNTNTATRTVIVRDTTPPTILWSFTNLILAADTNCSAVMPDVTSTNSILATDLSAPLAISQSPTNNTVLLVGTNVVVIAVADAFGNTAYATNTVVVQDQTPPVILSQPQNQTNNAGTTANFSAAATACTPLAWQWFFNNAAIAAQTNRTLTLSNVNLAAAGNYFVVASATGGASTSAVATLTVLIPPGINGAAANPDGSFNLNLTGMPGDTYILEATTNLFPPGNWLPVATNTPGTNGVWPFTDTSATNFPQQFYRLRLAQ